MEEPMMIAIAMDMLLQCGLSQSILRSTTDEQPYTMNRVRQRWLQHSAMVAVMTQKQVSDEINSSRERFLTSR
jgi:hypothetical protein